MDKKKPKKLFLNDTQMKNKKKRSFYKIQIHNLFWNFYFQKVLLTYLDVNLI